MSVSEQVQTLSARGPFKELPVAASVGRFRSLCVPALRLLLAVWRALLLRSMLAKQGLRHNAAATHTQYTLRPVHVKTAGVRGATG
jgi:hypothetical protein